MPDAARSDSPLTLYDADQAATLRILRISGGWQVRRSFNQIGIHAGDRIQVLRKAPFGGPLVIENRGTRVAVSKQLAQKIKVEIVS
jgi:Fe2+ transport system protein FeoA